MYPYVANSNKTNTVSATIPMFNLLGAAARRLKVYEIIVASDATPGDEASKFALMRTTTRGSQLTTIAPNPLDPEAPASIANLDTTWTGGSEPAITANSQLMQFAANHRSTFRWVAVPGSEIIVPAVANAGLALVSVVSTSPVNFAFSIFWRE